MKICCTRKKYKLAKHHFVPLPHYLLVWCERLCFDIITELHRNRVVLDCAKDLVNLAYLLLVLKIDWGIEVGYVRNGALAHQVILAWMCKVSQF